MVQHEWPGIPRLQSWEGRQRIWAVRGKDGRIGSGKTTRRFRRMPHLLSLTAHTDPNGVVWIAFPG